MTEHDVALVEAIRTPIGCRNGGLSTMHSIDLLATAQRQLFTAVGCRSSGRGAGGGQLRHPSRYLVIETSRATPGWRRTPDRGRGQHHRRAVGLVATDHEHGVRLVRSGLVDIAVGCGVEVMNRVPMGSSVPREPDVGQPVNETYRNQHNWTTQFEGAERMARRWGLSRAMCDAFGKLSHDRAGAAWADGRFDSQIGW